MTCSRKGSSKTPRRKLSRIWGPLVAIGGFVFAFALALGLTPLEQDVILTWYGHSMFTLEVFHGPAILTDPFDPEYYGMRYRVEPLDGVDVVTVSHEHADHNHIALATGEPRVLRGLTEELACANVDEVIEDVRFYTVCTCHVDEDPCPPRYNAVFVIEANGLRISHLGDLGHILTTEQAEALGPVDVLLIPVGGGTTIDATTATQVVELLGPKAIIPMHYRTPGLYWRLDTVDPFLEGKRVERPDARSLVLNAATLPDAPTVFVLRYE